LIVFFIKYNNGKKENGDIVQKSKAAKSRITY
jgi:hypothetical protein